MTLFGAVLGKAEEILDEDFRSFAMWQLLDYPIPMWIVAGLFVGFLAVIPVAYLLDVKEDDMEKNLVYHRVLEDRIQHFLGDYGPPPKVEVPPTLPIIIFGQLADRWLYLSFFLWNCKSRQISKHRYRYVDRLACVTCVLVSACGLLSFEIGRDYLGASSTVKSFACLVVIIVLRVLFSLMVRCRCGCRRCCKSTKKRAAYRPPNARKPRQLWKILKERVLLLARHRLQDTHNRPNEFCRCGCNCRQALRLFLFLEAAAASFSVLLYGLTIERRSEREEVLDPEALTTSDVWLLAWLTAVLLDMFLAMPAAAVLMALKEVNWKAFKTKTPAKSTGYDHDNKLLALDTEPSKSSKVAWEDSVRQQSGRF
jgi:hypothetical protein